MNDIILSTQNGEPVASSRDVAERFGKEHKDVLRSIKNLTAQNCALLKMFHKTEYTTAQNKKATMYLMNRDGFSLLAELRRQGDIPVLFLSARDEDEARLRGLGLGVT